MLASLDCRGGSFPKKTRHSGQKHGTIIAVIGFPPWCTHGPRDAPQTWDLGPHNNRRMGLRLALAQGSDSPTNSARRRHRPQREDTKPRRHQGRIDEELDGTIVPTRMHHSQGIVLQNHGQGAEEVQSWCAPCRWHALGACSKGPAFLWCPTSGCTCFFPSSTFISWLPRMQLA